MSQFHIKSILLGIGIGVIVTATASMIYMAGIDPMESLTKEQIIKQAEKYGMVKQGIIFEDTRQEDTKK
jgi:recombinational DNA repair protein RecT